MAAPRPRTPAMMGLLDDPETARKWEQTKQVLWDSNLNTPVRAFYNLMNTPVETLLGDMGAAGEQAVADSFDAAGGMMVGGAVVPKPTNALNMGIRAYHGSPHSFDKFSMDKIGTGEGAQAYGHGLYFAENEGVAKSYRDALSTNKGDQSLANDAMSLFGDKDAAIAFLEQSAPQVSQKGLSDSYKRAADLLRTGNSASPGHMYEVEINADPAHFLDWDKPLSEQQEVLAKLGDVDPSFTGDVLHQKMFHAARKEVGGNQGAGVYQQAVRKQLNEAGIPGIKYLDAGSRGAGDGTRNYVVFDDSLINIIRKYGIAGLLGGAGLYGMTNDEAQAGAY